MTTGRAAILLMADDTRVIYRPTGEIGHITSVNELYIFVRFLGDEHSKACLPADLTEESNLA